jgi:hypothetical protein
LIRNADAKASALRINLAKISRQESDFALQAHVELNRNALSDRFCCEDSPVALKCAVVSRWAACAPAAGIPVRGCVCARAHTRGGARASCVPQLRASLTPILEEYGLSCENDMSLLEEKDLVVLCSKLKPFPSKLLRKWVQGLVAEQRVAAFMKHASAAQCVCVCVCVCV